MNTNCHEALSRLPPRFERKDVARVFSSHFPGCFDASNQFIKGWEYTFGVTGAVEIPGTQCVLHFASSGDASVGGTHYSYVNYVSSAGIFTKSIQGGQQTHKGARAGAPKQSILKLYAPEYSHFIMIGVKINNTGDSGKSLFTYLGPATLTNGATLASSKTAIFSGVDFKKGTIASFQYKEGHLRARWDNWASPTSFRPFEMDGQQFTTVRDAVRSDYVHTVVLPQCDEDNSVVHAIDYSSPNSFKDFKESLGDIFARPCDALDDHAWNEAEAYRRAYVAKADSLRNEFKKRMRIVADEIIHLIPRGRSTRPDVAASDGFNAATRHLAARHAEKKRKRSKKKRKRSKKKRKRVKKKRKREYDDDGAQQSGAPATHL